MQADTVIKPQTETEKLFSLDKPSLENLSYVLRHPDAWPEGFEWDYGNCQTCAMGLAHRLWTSVPKPHPDVQKGSSRMGRSFALPFEAAESIFFGGDWSPEKSVGHLWWRKWEVDRRLVTPGMVADQIDQYLTTVK